MTPTTPCKAVPHPPGTTKQYTAHTRHYKAVAHPPGTTKPLPLELRPLCFAVWGGDTEVAAMPPGLALVSELDGGGATTRMAASISPACGFGVYRDV